MTNFKEWLAEQAVRQSNGVDRQARIKEWIQSVTDLLNQIEVWIREDDSNRVLTLQSFHSQRREVGLGIYSIPLLQIALFDQIVEVVPLSRNVAGGVVNRNGTELRTEGRVDLSNGAEKYMMYHVRDSNGLKWVIVDDKRYETGELTKERFQAALQDLFS